MPIVADAEAGFGGLLNAHLFSNLGTSVNVNLALDPEARALMPAETLDSLVSALDGGLSTVYLIMAGMALVGILVALLFSAPRLTRPA